MPTGVYIRTKTHCKNISIANKGKHLSETEFKKGQIPWNKDKKFPQITGSKHPGWKGGKPLCIDCGKRLKDYNSKKCPPCHYKGNKGKNNPFYKGGQTKKDNRIFILMPEHPFLNKKRYIRRSRLVMEKKLGRYLKPKEVVHHINKIVSDDRPENLQLFPNNSAHMKFHKLPI